MFLDLKNALKIAKQKHFAIGAFNVFDLESVKAVAEAAKEASAPVIIQTTPKAIEYAGLNQLFDIIKNEIHSLGVRAAIHLDHGEDFGLAKSCIDIGYNSVMIDGSKLDFEANKHITKKVVQYAKEFDVQVEAELGAIGRKIGEGEYPAKKLTNPNLVDKFIAMTQIDSLGISVGNAHGAPKGEKVDFDLLAEIGSKTEIPLVMHGSSGLSEQEIKMAIKYGVAKFNIDTNLRKAFIREISHQKGISDPRDIMKKIMSAQKNVAKHYIKLLGSEGKYEEV